jgi:hypothetical protein
MWSYLKGVDGVAGFKEMLDDFYRILIQIVPELEAVDFNASEGEPEFKFSWGSVLLSWLSMGQQRIVLLVADLFLRAMILNPHLGTEVASLTEGVVLIDEIDQSLHPSWQRTVLRGLIESFPKIQFIVTTHAEQVLAGIAGLDDAPMIRRLIRDPDGALRASRLLLPTGLSSDKLLLGEWFNLSTTLDHDTAQLIQRHVELLSHINGQEIDEHAAHPAKQAEERQEFKEIEAELLNRLRINPGLSLEAHPDSELRARRLAFLHGDDV